MNTDKDLLLIAEVVDYLDKLAGLASSGGFAAPAGANDLLKRQNKLTKKPLERKPKLGKTPFKPL